MTWWWRLFSRQVVSDSCDAMEMTYSTLKAVVTIENKEHQDSLVVQW